MTQTEEYALYLKRREAKLHAPMADYWFGQEARWVEPFHIYGGLWFVGDSWVCAHIIRTPGGLILLDTGNCGATAMLIHAIWKAGFNPEDIKWVIVSHGHVDHFGGVRFLKNMFGCKTYIGAPDAALFREHPEQSIIQESTDIADEVFRPDVELHDGDVINFGGLEIAFRLVPGHSPGAISCFFDLEENGVVKRAGYYGGFGLNTLAAGYLRSIGDSELSTRRTYLESLASVRDERVDIFVGNHTANNDYLAKVARRKERPGENPFVDSAAWGKYLDLCRSNMLRLMETDK